MAKKGTTYDLKNLVTRIFGDAMKDIVGEFIDMTRKLHERKLLKNASTAAFLISESILTSS